MSSPDAEEQGFDARTRQVERTARSLLTERPLPGSRRADPELRKNLARLYRAMGDARRLRLDDRVKTELLALLAGLDLTTLNNDASGVLMEAVDELLIANGDVQFLSQVLAAEYDRDRIDANTPVATWSKVGNDRVDPSPPWNDGTLERVRSQLLALYRTREMSYRLERTRSLARARRLPFLAVVLSILVLALIPTIGAVVADVTWRGGVLAALAGAVGATLSGAFKLRDQAPRVSDMRVFWYVFAVQPLIGAVAGLFLLLVLLSGIVKFADTGNQWATRAAVAFVAGFSEPFLLKTVGRIAGGE